MSRGTWHKIDGVNLGMGGAREGNAAVLAVEQIARRIKVVRGRQAAMLRRASSYMFIFPESLQPLWQLPSMVQ